jgi:hypothetical protein
MFRMVFCEAVVIIVALAAALLLCQEKQELQGKRMPLAAVGDSGSWFRPLSAYAMLRMFLPRLLPEMTLAKLPKT